MFIYCLCDGAGRPRYVGWTGDVDCRLREHWKNRNSKARKAENPDLCEWLAGQLFPPAIRVLAEVPYAERYTAERAWTIQLAARYRLFNISYGAAPLRRPWMTERNKRRGGAESPSIAAA